MGVTSSLYPIPSLLLLSSHDPPPLLPLAPLHPRWSPDPCLRESSRKQKPALHQPVSFFFNQKQIENPNTMEPALTTLLAIEITSARRALVVEMRRVEYHGVTHDWYTLSTRDHCLVVDRSSTCQAALASLRWVLEQAVAASRGLRRSESPPGPPRFRGGLFL